MAKTIQVIYNTPVATVAGATDYWACGNGLLSKSGTEVNRQVVFRSAGTLAELFVRLTQNSTSASSSVTVRKNAAAGNQTVSIGSAATGVFEDTTNTDAIVAGDKLAYQSITGTGGTITVAILSTIFDATTNTVARHVSATLGTTTFNTVSVSRYNTLSAEMSAGVGAEASTKCRIQNAGTLKNMQVYASANTSTVACTVNSRKNGAAGALTLSIGSTATGLFEDTTHTDSLVAGDDSNSEVVTGTNAGLSLEIISFEFETTTGNGFNEVGRPGAYSPGTAITSHFPLAGDLVVGATESDTQVKAREAFTFSNLSILATANAITATSTLTFRKNAAAGNQSVSIGSSATGVFTDAVNTDAVVATDLVNTRIVTGGTGTTMTIRNIEMTTFFSAGGPPPPPTNIYAFVSC